ncbi:MAG: TetR/AcrR family transcriptional regulator [Alphaproteobacteria bacterium]|nr:TetR/AcrR family transcriptional regulator [Alphaproteobacteria bacterium]
MRRADTVPEHDGAALEGMTWQAQKSAATRRQILEATISCFVELGYAQTTTTKIAERAGLSRGAMLHHFPSKKSVVKSAIEYLHAKRLRAFRKAVANIPEGKDRLKQGMAAYWAHVTHPMFFAFLELKVAARTDTELASILRPEMKDFSEQWHATARELFPEWHSDPEALDMALDMIQNVMDGLVINLMNGEPDAHVDRMLAHLEDCLRQLRPGGPRS